MSRRFPISLPPRGAKLVFASRTYKKGKDDKVTVYTHTYTRPPSDRPQGKTALRYAKRLKVAAMKALGHVKGDNTPFDMAGLYTS